MTWKPLEEFPGYEISESGDVRSWRGRGPRAGNAKQPRIITPVWLPDAERWAVRMTLDGVRYMRCIANLVLNTFIGPPPPRGQGTANNDADVVFKDGNVTNVTLNNLTWRIQ